MFRCRREFLGAGLVGFGLLAAGSNSTLGGQTPPAGNGKALFERRCGGCHALDRDKEGPRLGDVVGRVSGSVASFEYSDALKKSKITWNEESLEKWLTDPAKLVPNNDMSFHLENAGERREIIGYLKQNTGR